MFHYFVWDINVYWTKKILTNKSFWIEVNYEWKRTTGEFFIFPYFDQNFNTYMYIAFDTIDQKLFFENIYKLPWIGLKIAYNISMIDYDTIKTAIENFDIKFFQSLPWVWPKTAKRLVVELKNTVSEKDIVKLNIDEKLYKDIIWSLKTLWYETNKVKKILEKCPLQLDRDNLSNIIKWVIDNI